jgi:hypothetical protein
MYIAEFLDTHTITVEQEYSFYKYITGNTIPFDKTLLQALVAFYEPLNLPMKIMMRALSDWYRVMLNDDKRIHADDSDIMLLINEFLTTFPIDTTLNRVDFYCKLTGKNDYSSVKNDEMSAILYKFLKPIINRAKLPEYRVNLLDYMAKHLRDV